MNYNDTMPADQQVAMEEAIAAELFLYNLHEEAAADLGRDVLRMVLAKFRPDLMEGFIGVRDEFQFLVLRALRSLLNTQVGGQHSRELVLEMTRQIDLLDIHEPERCPNCGSYEYSAGKHNPGCSFFSTQD